MTTDKTKLQIALLQVTPGGALEENLEKGIACCRKAWAMGVDIVLFSEMWSNGYRIDGRPADQWTADAIPADGAFVLAFGALAKELEMAVGVAYTPASDGSRDTCILQAGGEEGIYIASLDLAQLRAYRACEVHGNAYRHPRKYSLLTRPGIEAPFIRDYYRA